MDGITLPLPLWWRLWQVLRFFAAFAVSLLPKKEQPATEQAGQLAAEALDTYGNAILRCAYNYLHNMADAEMWNRTGSGP